MFNKNFYPTPKDVIQHHLLEGIQGRDLYNKIILEPSAGKGDILDHIASWIKYDMNSSNEKIIKENLFCIEIEQELQSILSEKGYRLLGHDFLSDPINIRVDYIFMNPPFDQGAKHLLRAWDVMHCGVIRCLLNASTYDNPHTKERELLKNIIDQHGSVKRIGAAFKEAERRTNIEVIVVELVKVSEERLGLDLDLEEGRYHRMPDDIGAESSLPVLNNALLSRESIFNNHIEAYKDKLKAEMLYHKRTDFRDYKSKIKNNDYNKQLNDFVLQLTSSYWESLINESNYAEFLTHRLRKEFLDKQFPTQRLVAFTYENMKRLLGFLLDPTNKATVMNNCILDCFDSLTMYHEKNKIYIEGWKSNDAYKVSKKVILPLIMKEYEPNSLIPSYGIRNYWYGGSYVIDDLDMVMCYLSGKRRYTFNGHKKKDEVLTIRRALELACAAANEAEKKEEEVINTFESEFFKGKFFKKGTLHLWFKDPTLLQFFNCIASELRGYPLPEAKEVYKRNNYTPQQPIALIG